MYNFTVIISVAGLKTYKCSGIHLSEVYNAPSWIFKNRFGRDKKGKTTERKMEGRRKQEGRGRNARKK